MLVDVVELRHKGQKLPRDYVRLSTPVRGDLSIGTRIGDSAGELVPFAFLSEVDSTRTVLPGLDYAVCMPMRGDHFLVRGSRNSSTGRFAGSIRRPGGAGSCTSPFLDPHRPRTTDRFR